MQRKFFEGLPVRPIFGSNPNSAFPMSADAEFQNIEAEELNLSRFFDVAVRVFEGTEALVKRIGRLVINIQKVDR